MRDILAGYKIFNIDPKKLRSKDFFKNVLEYRNFVMEKFPNTAKQPDEFRCLLCGSANGKEFLKYKEYPLFECLNCGMVSPNVDLSKVDEKLVYDSETALADVKNDVINNYDYRKATYAPERLNYILEKTGLKKEEVKLLDVGCGPGYLLEHLKENSVNYKGLELADFLVEICKGRGLNVEKSDLANEPDAAYNVITLFDVLEHLREPVEMFETLNKKLETGGYVLAYTPNIHSIAFRLMGGLQNNVYPYIHLCFFDPRSLNYLAEKTGFRVQSIDYYGLDIMDYLSYKNFEDDYDYLGKLHEFIPIMQAIIDKEKISNHQRIIFKKL